VKKAFLLIFLVIVVFLGLKFIKFPKNLNTNQDKVSVTIFPIFDIVRNVAGDEVEVVLILPPGASPHTFDPTPQEIKEMVGSQAVFAVGHGLDSWVSKISESAGVEKTIIVDKNINLTTFELDDEDGSHVSGELLTNFNPHYWLSVKNANQIAGQVRDELVLLFPDKQVEITSNYKKYIARLNLLDSQITEELSELDSLDIATFHNAWWYFAKDYDINIVATFEEFPGEAPTAVYLKNFQEDIRESETKVIFAEPQFSTSPLEPIANDLGVSISTLDPIGGVNQRATYEDLMRYNLNQIVRDLK
jgi:zinc transport system substrate-binding protein